MGRIGKKYRAEYKGEFWGFSFELEAEGVDICGEEMPCGGHCCFSPAHDGPHMCCGDVDGPGTCPA